MMTKDDKKWAREIHKAIGYLIHLADHIGVVRGEPQLKSVELKDILEEIEAFMKNSLEEGEV